MKHNNICTAFHNFQKFQYVWYIIILLNSCENSIGQIGQTIFVLCELNDLTVTDIQLRDKRLNPGTPKLDLFVLSALSGLGMHQKHGTQTETLKQKPSLSCVKWLFRITRDMPGYLQWQGSFTRMQEYVRSNRSSSSYWLFSHSWSQWLGCTAGHIQFHHIFQQTLGYNFHFCMSAGIHIYRVKSIELINLSRFPPECFPKPHKGFWPLSLSSEEVCGCGRQW